MKKAFGVCVIVVAVYMIILLIPVYDALIDRLAGRQQPITLEHQIAPVLHLIRMIRGPEPEIIVTAGRSTPPIKIWVGDPYKADLKATGAEFLSVSIDGPVEHRGTRSDILHYHGYFIRIAANPNGPIGTHTLTLRATHKGWFWTDSDQGSVDIRVRIVRP